MYLFGASGHGKVIAEIAEENGISISGFIDRDETKESFIGYPVTHFVPENQIELILSIGSNKARKRLTEKYPHFIFKTLIHPKANLSKYISVEEGSVIMAGVTVNPGVQIGKQCIINTNASIDHDCIIHDFVHISPNAALAGDVEVGEGSHIGIGASVIQGIKIGKWCTIGAGSVIIKDVPDYAVVVGNPAKIIKMNNLQERMGGGKTP